MVEPQSVQKIQNDVCSSDYQKPVSISALNKKIHTTILIYIPGLISGKGKIHIALA